MKKIAFMSLIAVFAMVVLSSYVRLTNHTENKLGKNQDFKNWVSGVNNLKANIEKTNTKVAFMGFLKGTNTALQNENLYRNLGFSNSEAINTTMKKLNFYKKNFIKSMPQLLTADASSIIHQALQENMLEVPNCWDVYTIRSMNCFSGSSSPAEEQACEEAAWNALLNCIDPPYIP